MTLNTLYRACGDGPMFDSYAEAEDYNSRQYGGTTWVCPMAWCNDCEDWVEEGRMEHCPNCGAKWYDEEGMQGFRDGMGVKKYNLHKARLAELKEQKQHERQALAAWNAWASRS